MQLALKAFRIEDHHTDPAQAVVVRAGIVAERTGSLHREHNRERSGVGDVPSRHETVTGVVAFAADD
jgi:hypothetical protein